MMQPDHSWVARWLRLRGAPTGGAAELKGGLYAIRLPGEEALERGAREREEEEEDEEEGDEGEDEGGGGGGGGGVKRQADDSEAEMSDDGEDGGAGAGAADEDK